MAAETTCPEQLVGRGLTVRDLAARYRVGPDKIRAWIRKGELKAIDTASSRVGKPRWVFLPHHLAEFERGREAGPPPKAARRSRLKGQIDFYPDR
jgi:transposase